MSDKSSSEERGNDFGMDPIVKECFKHLHNELEQLRKEMTVARARIQVLENESKRVSDDNDNHILDIQTLRRKIRSMEEQRERFEN